MSELKVIGAISAIYPTQIIQSKGGETYNKMTFIVTNNDGRDGADKSYSFEIFEKSDGEKIEKFLKYNKVGDNVEVSYDIRCNENPKKEGQWFTSLSAFKVWGLDKPASEPESPPVDEVLDEEPPF